MGGHLARLLLVMDARAARWVTRLAVFAGLALWAIWPFLALAPDLNTFRDAQVLDAYEVNAVHTVLHFGQVPLWDPYSCGGVYMLGNPQSRSLAPPFLLSLLFGARRGAVVIAFVMLLLGMEGLYRYARDRGASALGAAALAPTFALCGWFAVLLPHGWLNYAGYALMPWVLLGVRQAGRGTLTGVLLGSIGFAWMLGFGGSYPMLTTVLLAAYEGGVLLLRPQLPGRERRVVASGLGLLAVASIGLCAVRVWPMAEVMAMAPRLMLGTPGSDWGGLGRMLLHPLEMAPDGTASKTGLFYMFAPVLLLALAGLANRRGWALVPLIPLSLWLATGYAANPSLFGALRELPAFFALRYPERFLLVFVLIASVLGALGIDLLIGLARRRPWVSLAALAGVAISVAAWPFLIDNHHRAAAGMHLAPPPAEIERPFHQARGNRWQAGSYAPMNRGSLSCMEGYPVPQSAELRGDLPAEEYLVPASAGNVSRTSWAPNRIELLATLAEPGRLRVNQNWHPGWRSNVGTVVSDGGLLAVDLPAGEHRINLRFLPRSALGGLAVSLATLVAFVWLRVRRARLTGPPRWDAMVAAAAPMASFMLVWLALSEPPIPRGEPSNATGEPAVVDRLPETSTGMRVHFEEPVSLVGASLPEGVRPPGTLRIELNWQREGAIEGLLHVFVHVEAPDGSSRLIGDHEAVASSMRLSAAPRGRIVRDVLGIFIPANAAQGTWNVYAGLWRPVEDGSRLLVSDSGGRPAGEDRVWIGSFTVHPGLPAGAP